MAEPATSRPSKFLELLKKSGVCLFHFTFGFFFVPTSSQRHQQSVFFLVADVFFVLHYALYGISLRTAYKRILCVLDTTTNTTRRVL